jgi:predicted transcriptional regulator of viral defense system
LSGRPLRTIVEPPAALSVGASKRGAAYVSDIDRALLDAAARPELVGGAAVLAEAIVSAARHANPDRLMSYAGQLKWAAALRRIGSIADALDVDGLAKKLKPLTTPTSDLELEPGAGETAWRDSRWWVRWAQSHGELANVARQ